MSEDAPGYGSAPDPGRTQALINLFQANRVIQDRMEDRLQAAAGLSLAQHEILARLAAAPEGRLRMLDLASFLLVSKSGATRLVDRLVANGLVARAPCAEDRRVVYAEITHEGRDALQRAFRVWMRGLEDTFSAHLSDTDVRALRRALRRLLEGNGAWADERCESPVSSPAATR